MPVVFFLFFPLLGSKLMTTASLLASYYNSCIDYLATRFLFEFYRLNDVAESILSLASIIILLAVLPGVSCSVNCVLLIDMLSRDELAGMSEFKSSLILLYLLNDAFLYFCFILVVLSYIDAADFPPGKALLSSSINAILSADGLTGPFPNPAIFCMLFMSAASLAAALSLSRLTFSYSAKKGFFIIYVF